MATEDLSRLKIKKPGLDEGPRQKKFPVRIAAASALILILLILFIAGIFTPAIRVEVTSVVRVYPSQAFTLLNASGYVVAQRKSAVASKITGRLVSISVEEGSRVTKGQVIARLENEDVLAAKKQAEANLNNSRHLMEQAEAELNDARVSYARTKELLSKGFVAKSDYDTAEARYKKDLAAVEAAKAGVKASQAALLTANVNVDYTLIRAPFDAVVLTKNADIGDIVTPIGAAANVQSAVVTIADMDSLQVEADVSESSLSNVRLGQPCEIQLDSVPDTRFRGEVHMIVPTADRTKATVMVKVRFLVKDKRILPEMSAKVAFLRHPVKADEEKPRTALNSNAILSRGQKQVVFAIKNGTAVETEVKTGEHLDEMTEIISGVKPGDKVVLKPLDKVKNGSKVKVAEGT